MNALPAPGAAAPPWQRHQLVWLDEFGWYRLLADAAGSPGADAPAQACIELWAEKRWPLVVTQQGLGTGAAEPGAPLLLGLPAPAAWGRRRIALQAPARAVQRSGHFPRVGEIRPLLGAGRQGPWDRLCADLDALGLAARVYGSHGWQQLTGETYVHAASDIDLLLPVAHAAQADAAGLSLQAAASAGLRLDGELVFPGAAAVAWREWVRWRAGQTASLLVKRLEGASLVDRLPEATSP